MKSRRFRFFLSHLAISTTIIFGSAAFIVFAWYPPPFAQLEGILSILLVMACVDACAGPLCTLVAASPEKPNRELTRDMCVIAAIQLLALGYAIYTTAVARPVFVAYNVGQFDIEHANEIPEVELKKAASGEFSRLPWFGPIFVEARFPDDPNETMKIVGSATSGGLDIKDMPMYFHPWPPKDPRLVKNTKLVTALSAKGELREKVRNLLGKLGVAESEASVLAVNGKTERGTVVLRSSDREILGIIPILTP